MTSTHQFHCKVATYLIFIVALAHIQSSSCQRSFASLGSKLEKPKSSSSSKQKKPFLFGAAAAEISINDDSDLSNGKLHNIFFSRIFRMVYSHDT